MIRIEISCDRHFGGKLNMAAVVVKQLKDLFPTLEINVNAGEDLDVFNRLLNEPLLEWSNRNSSLTECFGEVSVVVKPQSVELPTTTNISDELITNEDTGFTTVKLSTLGIPNSNGRTYIPLTPKQINDFNKQTYAVGLFSPKSGSENWHDSWGFIIRSLTTRTKADGSQTIYGEVKAEGPRAKDFQKLLYGRNELLSFGIRGLAVHSELSDPKIIELSSITSWDLIHPR
jgi:hypothetical protein